MTQTIPAKKNFFNQNVDLMNGPIFKSLFIFMLPIFVSNLFQQLYNTVDTMIVGNVLGDTALAAIGSCGSIYELLVGFGIGIGNGLAIVAARSYGAQDEDLLKKTVAGSLVIGFLSSLCITLAGLVGLHPLLVLLDTPAEILEEAYSYILIIDVGVLVMFAYNLCAGLLRAIGNSFMPLVFLLISSGLNVALDLVFIAVVGMGVKGAAVATVISQGVSVVLCIFYVLRKTRVLVPERKHFQVGRKLYWDLFSQSISMGLMSSIVSAGYAGHRRTHRRPEDVRLYGYATHCHGECRFHVRLPELRCKPPGPCSQGDAGNLPLFCGGGRGGCSVDERGRRVDDQADLRFQRGGGAGKWCKISDLERAVLRGAGCAALHSLCPAEPGSESAAPLLQRH